MHIAAWEGRVDIVQILIEEFNDDVDRRDESLNTPLMRVSGWHMTEVAKILLKNGADWRLRNKEGETALDIAHRDNKRGLCAVIGEWSAIRMTAEVCIGLAALDLSALEMLTVSEFLCSCADGLVAPAKAWRIAKLCKDEANRVAELGQLKNAE